MSGVYEVRVVRVPGRLGARGVVPLQQIQDPEKRYACRRLRGALKALGSLRKGVARLERDLDRTRTMAADATRRRDRTSYYKYMRHQRYLERRLPGLKARLDRACDDVRQWTASCTEAGPPAPPRTERPHGPRTP